MIRCELCGKKSVIEVAENGGIKFFSCCNEECADFAGLLVETNGSLESVHEMLDVYKYVVKEITDEKDKVSKGKV